MYHHPGTTGSSSNTDPRLASSTAGGTPSGNVQPSIDPPPYSNSPSSSTDPRSTASYPAHLVAMPPPLAYSGAPAAPGHGSGGPPPPSITQLSSSTPGGAGTTPSTGGSWYGGGGGSSDIRLPSLTAQVAPLDHASNTPTMAQPSQVITVYAFEPQRGVEGTAITISCNLSFPPDHTRGDMGGNKIRLFFGQQCVDTTLRPPTNNSEAYLVIANVPSLHNCGMTGSNAWAVPVSLQAVSDRGILEVQNLGEFTYLSDSNTLKKARKLSSKTGSPERRLSSAGFRRRRREDESGYSTPAIPAGTAGAFVYDSPPPQAQSVGLVRTTQIAQSQPNQGPWGVTRQKADLHIEGDLLTMKNNWSPDMWANRRCLVHFERRQHGATVYTSFRAIEERDWAPNMTVISCLYHEARQECFFTSVDVIYLLECLMATRYTTEEKNRIRRNLESFKPTTLQKNEGQWQEFYAHIMNYPNPKPRNIDKGLKVFPWMHLEPALKKIFSNYSAYTSTPFTFDGPTSNHGQMVYSQHAHISPDPMGFAEERTSSQYGPSHASDNMSPYVSHLPSYHRPALSGGSASGVPAGSSSSGETSAPQTAYGEAPMPGYANMPPPPGPYGRDYMSYAPPSSFSMSTHSSGYYDQPPPSMQYPHISRGSSSSDYRVVGYHSEAPNPSRPHSQPSPHLPHNPYPGHQQQQPPQP